MVSFLFSIFISEYGNGTFRYSERKYIVFESSLKELLHPCQCCGSSCKVSTNLNGSMVTMTAQCMVKCQ